MKVTVTILAAVAALALGATAAQAAAHAMGMDCCKHCCDQDGKGQAPAAAPQQK